MSGLLISGPAGSSKSAIARQQLEDWQAEGRLAVAADFQALYAALTLAVRGPDGRFPLRDDRLLSVTEYIRSVLVRTATERGISVVLTNSDGDPDRRQDLLARIGAPAAERIVDPGEQTVRARLSDPVTGELSSDCQQAIARWYGRIVR